ncbi:MAG: hypothetical protein HY553_08410 [Elusimicrobia bacterium]|nr:hypothetical protein [Elusimicrobiota bacterium]
MSLPDVIQLGPRGFRSMAGWFYRVSEPVEWLRTRGLVGDVVDVDDETPLEDLVSLRGTCMFFPVPQRVIFDRLRGNDFVINLDDDYWTPTPWLRERISRDCAAWGDRPEWDLRVIERALAACTAAIVTTPALADRVGQWTRAHIIPNAIADLQRAPRTPPPGSVRIAPARSRPTRSVPAVSALSRPTRSRPASRDHARRRDGLRGGDAVSARPRSVLHGTCLLDGKHPPGSPWPRECPLVNAGARSERSRRAARTRRALSPPTATGGLRPSTPR